jgi:RNA recognition motif-containing protein
MKIYVGNLAPATTDTELRAAFTVHGAVESARLATDRETGQPKGFGFLEMLNDEEANKAISALNGTLLGGNPIKVNEAKPKPQNGSAPTPDAAAKTTAVAEAATTE